MAMTPLDAWHIISANLAHLVRLRRCNGDPKGFVPADTEAEVIAFKALQEMQERMYPKPLGESELSQMIGEPVWVETGGFHRWGIVECDKGGLYVASKTADGYRINWKLGSRAIRCYRYKPTEVYKNA